MKLTARQNQVLNLFPKDLYRLVHAELSAGNSIVEVGHSFPAPPAGAYVKLANVVSTRPRASGNGLTHRERNSSDSSGEFTDAKRFYFVVEPASADAGAYPPVAVQVEPETVPQFVLPPMPEPKPGAFVPRAPKRKKAATPVPGVTPAPAPVEVRGRVATSYSAHCSDSRAPHEMRFAVERKLGALFTERLPGEKLSWRTTTNVNGGQYMIDLTFECALTTTNGYSLSAECSWADYGADNDDYFRRTTRSWFNYWTKEFAAAEPPDAKEGSAERYAELRDAALKAEANLDTVSALQQEIIRRLKAGGAYIQSDKEGDTRIEWRAFDNGSAFVRTRSGDYPEALKYTAEAEFLKMLRQYYDGDVRRYAVTEQVLDIDAWRLIMRLMSAR